MPSSRTVVVAEAVAFGFFVFCGYEVFGGDIVDFDGLALPRAAAFGGEDLFWSFCHGAGLRGVGWSFD